MDPLEMARLVAELNLSTEANDSAINVAKELSLLKKTNVERCLVGKIFAAKQVNRETLRTQLPRIIQNKRPVDIEVVGENIFVILFTSEQDRGHALESGPWHFFQSLLVFKTIEGMQNPSDIVFDDFTVWVQCHNLPIKCMHPSVIKRIGEQIGKVEEVDIGEGGWCLGKYARVKVTRSIQNPLQQCVRIDPGEGDKVLILLLYEKLPDFAIYVGVWTMLCASV